MWVLVSLGEDALTLPNWNFDFKSRNRWDFSLELFQNGIGD